MPSRYPAWSTLLGAESSSTTALEEFGPVPTGYIWVVRDIVAYSPSEGAGFMLQGIQVTDSSGFPIWGIGQPWVQSKYCYRWTGHQVLDEGDYIYVAPQDDYWAWRISGYQLTNP